jgi:hypothetical protein
VCAQYCKTPEPCQQFLKLFLNIFSAPVLGVLCRPQANSNQSGQPNTVSWVAFFVPFPESVRKIWPDMGKEGDKAANGCSRWNDPGFGSRLSRPRPAVRLTPAEVQQRNSSPFRCALGHRAKATVLTRIVGTGMDLIAFAPAPARRAPGRVVEQAARRLGEPQAGFMDMDLAPQVRGGGILAVLPTPRPVRRGWGTPPRAVSSPLKGLRGRLDGQLAALSWLGSGQLVAQQCCRHPVGIRCAC